MKLKIKSECFFISAFLFVTGSVEATPISVVDFAKAKVSSEFCTEFRRRHDSVGSGLIEPNALLNDGLFTKSTDNKKYKIPASRDLKYTVKIGDTFLVTLQQALIKDFPEFRFFRSEKSGDIAIIASIRERSSGNDYNFKPGSEQEGRVVFFQKNVSAGAPLNLANLPVYGPVRYEGKPLMVSLYILEIDEEDSKSASGIVDTLANLSKTVTPANTAAISVLNSLGNYLLKSNKNDILAEYRVEFIPAEGENEGVKNVVLEYGNYAFVAKQSKQSEWHEWENIRYNQRNGRIYFATNENDSNDICSSLPYKDETWLTFQINSSSQEAELPNSNTLALLLESLNQNSEKDIGRMQVLTQEIINLKKQGSNFKWALNVIKEANSIGVNKVDDDTKTAIKKIVKSLSDSINPQKDSQAEYDLTQRRRLVDEIKQILPTKKHLFSVDNINYDDVIKWLEI